MLDLQALDTKLDQLRHRRNSLPELARIAELDAQIEDLDAAIATSRTAAGDLRRELTKAESDVQQVRDRATKDQQRMESGIGSAKDLQALQSEIESLARRQSDLEDVELEVMERLEAHQSALDELTTAHAALLNQRAELLATRDAAWAEVDKEAEQVTAARQALAAPLPENLIAIYERLRGKLGGFAVAALRHGRSEGSGMMVPPIELAAIKATPEDQLVYCEESGRILVRGEDAF
nr:C4-type zinc ribbon domain-containing protein [Cellulomonas denverensis]